MGTSGTKIDREGTYLAEEAVVGTYVPPRALSVTYLASGAGPGVEHSWRWTQFRKLHPGGGFLTEGKRGLATPIEGRWVLGMCKIAVGLGGESRMKNSQPEGGGLLSWHRVKTRKKTSVNSEVDWNVWVPCRW